jgi:hypothetical protein
MRSPYEERIFKGYGKEGNRYLLKKIKKEYLEESSVRRTFGYSETV